MTMKGSKASKSRAAQHVSCSVCMKEVPKSDALKRESSDHTLYFCGTGCLDRWVSWDHRQDADDIRRAVDDGMQDLRMKNSRGG